MNNTLLFSLIGLAGGLAIGLQAPLSAIIGQRIGIMESVFIIHLGGTVAAALALIFMGGGNLGQWQTVPWYALSGGLLGVCLISAQVYIMPSIGVAAAITLIIAGQLLTVATVDHFGVLGMQARELSWDKILGLMIVLFGAWLTVRQQ